MPVYIRPARVDITESAGIGGLVLIGAAVAAAAAVAVFVLAHLLLLAGCAAAFVVVMGAAIGWMRWAASPARLRQQHHARPTVRVPAATAARAIPAPRWAIGARRTLPAATAVNREHDPRVR
jgi:hypothetical protein